MIAISWCFPSGGKWFCFVNITDFDFCTLKSSPDAARLCEQYEAVRPGYHMNHRHWISVDLHSDAPESRIFEWVDEGYRLVAAALPKSERAALGI